MISPRTRLLLWAAIAVPILAVGPVSDPGIGTALLILAGVPLLDAALSRGQLAGVSIAIPHVVRLMKDREGLLPLTIASSLRLPLRIGLPLPDSFESNESFIAGDGPIGWPVTASQRGSFSIENCAVEAASRFGFWNVRSVLQCPFEIRVYPNLLPERKNLAALFLNRGGIGSHVARMVGRGREFDKLREYLSGDAYDEIHWKATARRGYPVTKVFQMERTQEVYAVIDASRLSARKLGKDQTLDRFLTAALMLGVAAERQGDKFGVLAFGERVLTFVKSGSGRKHYGFCRDALYGLQPRLSTPDFGELASFIHARLKRRALLVFLTELDDAVIAEDFLRHIEMVRRKHLILVVGIKPEFSKPLFTGADVTTTDEVYQNLGGHLIWHNLRELEKTLRRHGIGFSQVPDERLSAEAVSRYVDIKRRQIL